MRRNTVVVLRCRVAAAVGVEAPASGAGAVSRSASTTNATSVSGLKARPTEDRSTDAIWFWKNSRVSSFGTATSSVVPMRPWGWAREMNPR